VVLTSRDRRAVIILLFASAGMGLYRLTGVSSFSSESKAVTQGVSVEHLRNTLLDRRKAAAAVLGKEEVLQQLMAELAVRERPLIQADTAAQAQARLLQILKKVMNQQQPSLEIKQVELSSPRQFSETYGEVSVSVTTQCTIDELVNLLTDLTVESEVIATDEISLSASNQNTKTLQMRLTVTGLVSQTLFTKSWSPQI
jgi:hypothetical protein